MKTRMFPCVVVLMVLVSLVAFATGTQDQPTDEETSSAATAVGRVGGGLDRIDQYNSIGEFESATGLSIELNEAPMLKEMVAAGEIPALEDRLPANPIVVTPYEEIGQYGGTIQLAAPGEVASLWNVNNASRPETILVHGSVGEKLFPNLAEDWEFSTDFKTLTLYLRRGVKWSDGVEFTTDDLMFWYEDILLNDELTPAIPEWMQPGGELAKWEALDAYTLRIRFEVPTSWYTEIILPNGSTQQGKMLFPKHYLEQFHATYVSADKLEKLAKDDGFENWVQLFQAKSKHQGGTATNVGVPTIGSYVLESKGVTTVRLVRNPYFFKIDTAGNQLPYIDYIQYSSVGSNEVYEGKIFTGELDFAGWATDVADFPLYAQNTDAGDYRVMIWKIGIGSRVIYNFNYTSEDLVLREIVNDVRFRQSMSLALDREEMAEVAFLGFSDPYNYSVLPSSKWFEPEFPTAYADYNSDEANRLLDEMGLVAKDRDGFRLRPDGKKLSLLLDWWDVDPIFPTISDIAVKNWEDIGVEVIANPGSAQQWVNRSKENKYDMRLLWMPTDGAPAGEWLYRGLRLIPIHPNHSIGPLWTRWLLSDGEEGEKPPEEILRQYERFENLLSAVSEEETIRLGKEMLRSQAENLWYIGTVSATNLIVASNRLRNLPPAEIDPVWGQTNVSPNSVYYPEQMFLRQ